MRIVYFTAVVLAATGAAHAGEPAGAAFDTVTVCTEVLPGNSFEGARITAAALFRRAGVKLRWHNSVDCPAGAIQVAFSSNTPDSLRPGALAYALPHEGTRIVAFLDRIGKTTSETMARRVLAYVLAHEIAHILQGYPHHSSSGIMKAHWERSDYVEMACQAFEFSAEDIELIRRGIAERSKLAALAMPVAGTHNGRDTEGAR